MSGERYININVDIGSGIGLGLLRNKPLPVQILTQIYADIMMTLGHSELNTNRHRNWNRVIHPTHYISITLLRWDGW